MRFRLKNSTKFLRNTAKKSLALLKNMSRRSIGLVKGLGGIKLRGRSVTRRAGNLGRAFGRLAGMTGKRIVNSVKFARGLTKRRR
jgi:hypothetical protein